MKISRRNLKKNVFIVILYSLQKKWYEHEKMMKYGHFFVH